MQLNHASPSPFVRTLRCGLRRALRQPLSRWIGHEPPIVLKVPALDSELLSAIRLIAPQYRQLRADPRSRDFWEREQNSSCWLEDAALGPVLARMPKPRSILEIGPGLGRSVVFLSRRYFPEARFDLFDATGYDTKYDLLGPRTHDTFCGNLPGLQRCLDFNGLSNYRLLDATDTAGRIPIPDAPYDFIFSFYAVGFHWDLDHWLDEVLAASHDATLCAFLVPRRYRPTPRVRLMRPVLLEGSGRWLPAPWSTVHLLVFTPNPVQWLTT